MRIRRQSWDARNGAMPTDRNQMYRTPQIALRGSAFRAMLHEMSVPGSTGWDAVKAAILSWAKLGQYLSGMSKRYAVEQPKGEQPRPT